DCAMINEAFLQLKSNLELGASFQETVQRHHEAVRSVIEKNGDKLETKLIGSLQRKTRVQPRSEDTFDIDILVNMGEFHSWVPSGGVTPQAAVARLLQVVAESDRYEQMNLSVDQPTVSFKYKDGTKV